MKKLIILFVCALLILSSGCGEKSVWDSSNTVSKDANVASNLLDCGHVIENTDTVVFDNYVYDKESGEISLLCKDPVCSHEKSPNSEENECILLKYISYLQLYDDNILCTANPASNNIYKLDPKTGRLSVFYEADMPVHAFILYSENSAIMHSADKGIYSVNLKTGESIELIKGALYNVYYTNDDNYLYISMEDLTLLRIDLSTGEDVILAERGAQPVIHGNKLYYQYITEGEWSLYSINIDGSEKTLILDDVMSYAVHGDKIYYSTASYPRKVLIYDINHENSKELLDDSASFYILPESEKVIMLLHSDYSYKIMDLDGSNIEDLTVPK